MRGDETYRFYDINRYLYDAYFSAGASKWRLTMHPNGCGEEHYVRLGLEFLQCNKTEVDAKVKFRILNTKGEENNALGWALFRLDSS